MKRKYVGGWHIFAGSVLCFLMGCQTYDFEPVEPLTVAQTTQSKRVIAQNARPNIMLLVDKSGSMDLPINPDAAGCQASRNCGTGPVAPNQPKSHLCPEQTCPTRWSELRNAMAHFLDENATLARLGMSTFPSDTSCGPTRAIQIPISPSQEETTPELMAQTQRVKEALVAIGSAGLGGSENVTGGGTPTGQSLQFVADEEIGLADASRENFIVLLTDGLPNCNSQNSNNHLISPNDCQCTLAASACQNEPVKGCLDERATENVVRSLVARKIKTIVVGFGADFASGTALHPSEPNPFVTLNRLAEAGGFALSCPSGTDAECGENNECGPEKLCRRRFFAATNGSELATALNAIASLVGNTHVCLFKLDEQPSDSRFLTALINGKAVAAGNSTWTYDSAAGTVLFHDPICQSLKNSSPSKPVNVEFRMVQGL